MAKEENPPKAENIVSLPGPTGESNMLKTTGRGVILCLGPGDAHYIQKRIAEANGSDAVMGGCEPALLGKLRGFDAVAYWGDESTKRKLRAAIAERDGPIIPLVTSDYALRNLVREQHICIDTTAAGGNASLLAGE